MLEAISRKRRRIIVPEVQEPPEGNWSNCFVVGIRTNLGMTQNQFASQFGFSVNTLRH